MSVVIKKIQFENYRQYGTGTINFRNNDMCNLYAFVAKNGTGKTTLLNAITWCLYEQEQGSGAKGDFLPVVSTSVLREADNDDYITVSVKLEIKDDEERIEFKRIQKFKKKIEKGISAIGGSSTFEAVVLKEGEFENPKKYTDDDAEILVKKYFDKAIYDFYFFDGENLKEFFNPTRSIYIKQSIQNISQVTLIKTAYDHVEKLMTKKKRLVGKDLPSLEELYSEESMLQDKIKGQDKIIKESVESIDAYNQEIIDIDNKLKDYLPIKRQQEQRNFLETQLKKLEAEKDKLIIDKYEFIRTYITLVKLYPRMKSTLDLILEKERQGVLPPSVDKSEIEKILQHPKGLCPVCNREINSEVINHLKDLLKKLEVSSATSNFLKEIKGTLEQKIDYVKQYTRKKKEILQREEYLDNEIKECEEKLGEISSSLANFNNSDDNFNVSKAENRRKDLRDRCSIAIEQKATAESTSKYATEDLKVLQEKIKNELAKMGEKKQVMKQLNVLSQIKAHFKYIIENITDNMRREIEDITWNIFRKMVWKQNTFGKVTIADDYSVKVYDKDENTMNDSSSATEKMALAYAFILAIHEASGKNCPLVIDSPLGRVSDENRKRMAEVLLKISKGKQIIMLFTPDEYSSSVKKLYDNVADVRELKLSDSEEVVEGLN